MALYRFLPRAVRRKLLLSKIVVDPVALGKVRVKVVETEEESMGAARVVHDSYVARGILPQHPTGVHVSTFSAAPGTWTFVAVLGRRVVGTISLVCDDGCLPMDAIYRSELDRLRVSGERLAEVGSLAIVPEFRSSGLVLWLNRILLRTAISLDLDRIVAAVHPDAEDIYRETLLFTRFGPERAYPGLNVSARAVAIGLELAGVEARYRQAFSSYGQRPCNTAWQIFESKIPQIEQPVDLGLARRAARRALRRARPDVVPARMSLASYSDAGPLLSRETHDAVQ